MIKEQNNDKELLDLFKITPVEAEKVSVGYLIKDNILMRKWSPTECDNSEKGKTVYQIVVPTVHRRDLLEFATGYKTVQVHCIPSRKSGSLERFNQTLKTMIKMYCIENS